MYDDFNTFCKLVYIEEKCNEVTNEIWENLDGLNVYDIYRACAELYPNGEKCKFTSK